jgi:hypothetical protein
MMNLTSTQANALLVTLIANLRSDLFEPSDYGIIELCDIMLMCEEDGYPELPDTEQLERQDAIEHALHTGLHVIYKTIIEFRPDHFKGDSWRYDSRQMIAEVHGG